MIIELIETNNIETGLLLIIIALAILLYIAINYRKDVRSYTNVLLADVVIILFAAAVGSFSRSMTLLFMINRVFSFLVVPLAAVVVGLLFIFNGIVVIKKEGFGRAALVPLLSGVALLSSMLFTILSYENVINPPNFLRPIEIYSVLASFFVAITFLTMTGFGNMACKMPKKVNCDYIVIHGCGIFGDRMTPMLKGRVDKAVELYKMSGGRAKLVPSGGMGPGETISEAECMRRYLETLNIPAEDIICEGKSTTTFENLVFVRDMLDPEKNKNYICVTSDYHAFRAAVYARKAGMKGFSVGSVTARYYRPTAVIREYIALMTDAKYMTAGLFVLWVLLTVNDAYALAEIDR